MNACAFQYDLFLSHNRANKRWVAELATRIEQVEWQRRRLCVFFDEWDIRPGENIPIALEKAIPASRKIGLVLSPAATQSPWVELERTIVTVLDPSNRQQRLLPILLQGPDDVVPPLARPLKYIDFRDPKVFNTSFNTLIAAIKDEPPIRQVRDPEAYDRPVNVNTPFERFLLPQFGDHCCLCHSQFEVHLFPLDPHDPLQDAGYHNLIALCPVCHLRVRDDAYPQVN